MIDLSGFGNIYSLLYSDKMTVQRPGTKTVNADGTTQTSSSLSTIYTNKACRISFEKEDSRTQDSNVNNSKLTVTKVFCEASLEIKKGDRLTISRIGENSETLQVYKGVACLASKYPSHQEIIVNQVGDA